MSEAVNAADVTQQMFVGGSRPTPDKVDPVTNKDHQYNKPAGGIWTSPVRDGSSPWLDHVDTAVNGQKEQDSDVYTLTPSADANLFVIDSKDDLDDLLDQYERDDIDTLFTPDCAPIDFEKLAQDYDGLRVTQQGLNQTHHLTPGMNIWDVPSTVWFSWSFDDVEKVGSA